ncbi:MAG: alpha/beta fold hydrolase [Silicimonas sp.]|jgi:magnesium chelatase accessory protein|nr:alpha/beta fold hydrolase [Silicimonas sp.]
MDWDRDLSGWSLPDLSRRIVNGPHRWHVQIAGDGPDLLLLPGSGASTHTWRAMIPELAKTHRVIALDLPGQGFTQSPNAKRSGLEETAEDIAALAQAEGWQPAAIMGHSAGVAIALRLSQMLGTPRIVGINPALDTFDGVAGWLFPFLAKLLAANPFTANLFTLGASKSRARRLIEGTGSRIGDEGLGYYTRLIADRGHVNGALQMMARWSLDGLLRDLPEIDAEVLFLTGANDTAVPPRVAEEAAARLPHARVIRLEGLGHLAHEEDPERVLSEIRPFL